MKSRTIVGILGTLALVASNGIVQSPVDAQSPAVAGLGTVTSIDVPGATNTYALGINSAGVIVGRYLSSGQTHGFRRDPAGDLTTIDYPGSSFTVAAAINDRGEIVGHYAFPTASTTRHGFLLKDGKFTSFDPPGSTFTNVLGINGRGDIVGRYCPLAACTTPGTGGGFQGFLLRRGTFTTVDVPGALESDAFAINERGQIAGGFVGADHEVDLFLLSHGAFTAIDLPGGQAVSLDKGGLNDHGDIVGTYCDSAAPCLMADHAFLLRRGRGFTPIDIPGAFATAAFAINARRDIVGSYNDATGTHGFLLSRWTYQAPMEDADSTQN
jgi:uncharacterized membrane protein